MIIQIEALDTLFFRDGKPFTMGDETWASGIFPPPPSVFYGALRSAYFSQHPDQLEFVNTDNDPTKDLIIKGIYMGLDEEQSSLLLPYPLDLVYSKDGLTKKEKRDERLHGKFKVYKLKSQENSYSSLGNLNILMLNTGGKVDELEESLIYDYEFQHYLEGERAKYDVKSLSFHLKEEPKVGIKRNNETNITVEGALYRTGFKRLKGMSFYLDIDFKEIKLKNQLIKLGGEGRIARLKNNTTIKIINRPNVISNSCRLYLATPTFFDNGDLPSWINTKTLEASINGIELILSTCAIGKPVSIGGFNMTAREPKPMKKAVPAGSVYYLKTKDGSEINFTELFANKFEFSVCDDREIAKQGFGLFYIGKS